MTQKELDYDRVKKSIEYISANYATQPELNEIADYIHLSPYHFQRLFNRWAGISPKKFLQYITIEKSKQRLEESSNLTDVAYDVGLSGTSRLHDLFINIEGMTPYQYKLRGPGIIIYYGIFVGPFGKYLLAVTDSGKICSIQFVEDEDLAEKELIEYWFNSTLIKSKAKIKSIAERVFNVSSSDPINILARGTTFQIKVWESLLKIPFGGLASYETIAKMINNPNAVQAVGSAIGNNPVAYLIPCHRVIRKAGNINQYRWGETRKKAIIGWESSYLEVA